MKYKIGKDDKRMKTVKIILLMITAMFIFVACGTKNESGVGSKSEENTTTPTTQPTEEATNTAAPVELLTGKHNIEIVIKDFGTIKCELDADAAPITVTNFISLVKSGFYDGLTFHRIMEGFMMQGGDPLGTGFGGADQTIKGEFANNGVENTLSHTKGALSMARSTDPNSASSQFFIVHSGATFLDGDYAVFGYVTEGMDVVDKVCTSVPAVDDNGTVTKENQPIITSIKVIE